VTGSLKRRCDSRWQPFAERKRLEKRIGFTLVELLVGVALTFMIVIGLHRLFSSATDITTRADTRTILQQNARHVLEYVEHQVAGAYVDVRESKKNYMWALNDYGDDYATGESATLGVTKDGMYGTLIEEGRPPAIYWTADELVGMFVSIGDEETRWIRRNTENGIVVDQPWEGSASSFSVRRNMDSLIFFTNSAQPWGIDPDLAPLAECLVMLAVDDEHVSESGRRLPSRLVSVVAPRVPGSGDNGRFESDLEQAMEVGRYVTDFNVEYAERIQVADDEYRLVYRQCNEESEGKVLDPDDDDETIAWAETGKSMSPVNVSRDVKSLIGAYASNAGGSVRFRRLPPALRVMIRVTNESGSVGRCFSQVMHLRQSSRLPVIAEE